MVPGQGANQASVSPIRIGVLRKETHKGVIGKRRLA
jgi:hypothetical protein